MGDEVCVYLYVAVVDWCVCVCTGEEPDVTGRKAAEELFRNIEHDGCVDEYLQDQVNHNRLVELSASVADTLIIIIILYKHTWSLEATV